jgi:formylglycine-generating enzyme required for sulfatase activity
VKTPEFWVKIAHFYPKKAKNACPTSHLNKPVSGKKVAQSRGTSILCHKILREDIEMKAKKNSGIGRMFAVVALFGGRDATATKALAGVFAKQKLLPMLLAWTLIALVGCSGGETNGGGPVVSIEMVQIPAGTFMMGSPTTEPNRQTNETQHSVTLTQSFKMSKYQVTQKQYQAVMGALPTSLPGSSYGVGDNYPVYYVSWYDAIVFCNKLSVMEGLNPVYSISGSTNTSTWGNIPTSSDDTWNAVVTVSSANGYRLPTEAEWEYACRGSYPNKATETNTMPFGIGDGKKMESGMANFDVTYPYDLDHSPAGEYNDASATGYVGKMTTVGSYQANNYGLYDMHGNVYEWCWDWYGTYASGAQSDPDGAVAGAGRVFRGGLWYRHARFLRSAFRSGDVPDFRNSNIGFRLVRS